MFFDFSRIRHRRPLNELSIGGKKIEDGPDEPTDYTQDPDSGSGEQGGQDNQPPADNQATPAPEQNADQNGGQTQDAQPQENPETQPQGDDAEGLIPGDNPDTDTPPEDYSNDPDSNPDNPVADQGPDNYNIPDDNQQPAADAPTTDVPAADPAGDNEPTDYTNMDDTGDNPPADNNTPPVAGLPPTNPNTPPAAGSPVTVGDGGDAPDPDGPSDYSLMDDTNDNPPADNGGGGGDAPADPNAQPAPTTVGGDDDGPTDYTNMDDTGDAGGGDAGAPAPEGDTGEGGGDQPPAEGEGDQQPQEGEEQQPEGESDELKQIEDQLFSNLSPEQISIRNIELRTKYIDLYNTIDKTITRVDLIEKTEKTLPIIDFIAKKLNELKIMVNDYIIRSFALYGYLENQINLQHYMVVLDAITKILEETKKYEEKDRKPDEDNLNGPE